MDLFTVGYEGRTLSQLIRLLGETGIERLVDVRERPFSRRKGFSVLPLSEALRKAGIDYVHEPCLGNPEEIRFLWKNDELPAGRRRYRALLRNGRSEAVELVASLVPSLSVCCAWRPTRIAATDQSLRRKQHALPRVWRFGISRFGLRRPEDAKDEEAPPPIEKPEDFFPTPKKPRRSRRIVATGLTAATLVGGGIVVNEVYQPFQRKNPGQEVAVTPPPPVVSVSPSGEVTVSPTPKKPKPESTNAFSLDGNTPVRIGQHGEGPSFWTQDTKDAFFVVKATNNPTLYSDSFIGIHNTPIYAIQADFGIDKQNKNPKVLSNILRGKRWYGSGY